MSGGTILNVGVRYIRLPGCSELQSRVSHRLVRTLVRSGGGVFAGAKPAALFSFNVDACARACEGCEGCSEGAACVGQAVDDALAALARGLAECGYGMVPFWYQPSRVMLLLYQASSVERLLQDASSNAFLRDAGYDTSSWHTLVADFVRRLRRYYATRCDGWQPNRRPDRGADGVRGSIVRQGDDAALVDACAASLRDARRPPVEFPHEIGILFGYPLEDVRGFLQGEVPTCRGPWAAYGDREEAQKRFDLLRKAEETCLSRYESGLSLGDIARREVA